MINKQLSIYLSINIYLHLLPVTMSDTNNDDDNDLDTMAVMAMMLDDEDMDDPQEEKKEEEEAVSAPSNPSTMAELGLVLSDDEEQPSTSSTSTPSFSAAFSQSKFSKNQQEKKKNNAAETVDPLESELREMEARVKLLQETLSKKKRLESSQSHNFTKLTTTSNQGRKTNSRTLSASEESKLRRRLARKSELHSGETDSEDEEDNRNPMEQQYNPNGRDMKHRIAHQSNSNRNERLERELAVKKPSPVVKQGWKAQEGALVSIGRKGAATSSQNTDDNVTLDSYSGIRIM